MDELKLIFKMKFNYLIFKKYYFHKLYVREKILFKNFIKIYVTKLPLTYQSNDKI